MTSAPCAAAGDADSGAPATNSQVFLPDPRSSSYNTPSFDPTKTRFPATSGEDSTRAVS